MVVSRYIGAFIVAALVGFIATFWFIYWLYGKRQKIKEVFETIFKIATCRYQIGSPISDSRAECEETAV